MAKKEKSSLSAELQAAIKKLNDAYGEGTVMGIDDSHLETERISSGSLILDDCIGGGYGKGKIIEIFGDESIGKSTLALHFMSNFKGKPIVYIDTEQSLDREYAKDLGVDTQNMIISQPNCLEDAIEILLEFADKVDAIVFDSIAEASPKAEIEGDMDDNNLGVKARKMSQGFRKLKSIKNSATILFINQIREKLGVMYGSPRTTPGGNASKFAAQIRIDLYGKELIKKGEDVIGHYIKAKIVKNKLGKPHLKCQIPLMYDGKGVNQEQEIVELAIEKGIIEKSGSWYKHGGASLGQGVDQVRSFLADNEEFKTELLNEIKKK
jgi:recombination protein RecA